MSTVELVLDAKAKLGEGPIWDADRQLLYWVNILDNELHIYKPSTEQDRVIDVGQYVGTVVPRRAGGVMLALHNGFAHLDLETEQLTPLTDPEVHLPDNRFNDGKCDAAGRFWAGTMSLKGGKKVGSLYRLDPDHTVHKMLEEVTTSNGIAWSFDNDIMYYIDTPTGTVDAFDFDLETGTISNRRTVITFPDGVGKPDGMTADSDGMLWVAHWGGGRVTRWDPHAGQLLQTVEVPAPNVTACAFGGSDLDQFYITTARNGLDDATLAQYPHAGGLFRTFVGVRGIRACEFAG